MIKVYVHNSEDLVGERELFDYWVRDVIFSYVEGEALIEPFWDLDQWTEIGEL